MIKQLCVQVWVQVMTIGIFLLGVSNTVAQNADLSNKIYGVVDAYVEKVGSAPVSIDASGNTVKEESPYEWDVPNLLIMFQGDFKDKFRYFLSLSGPGVEFDAPVGVRNAWLQYNFFGDVLYVRVGKLYRSFGLYNEILDATPTYVGIEPPELFDKDHLFITRTTNLSVGGKTNFGQHSLVYSIFTGNDEREGDEVPIGFDLYFVYGGKLRLGTSFYSTNGDAKPSVSVGEGSSQGGVLPWMAKDSYVVYGGYAQLEIKDVVLQAEIWQAKHNAERNPEEVLKLVDAGLNARQQTRFGLTAGVPVAADILTNGDYTATTAYTRLGYTMNTGWGDVIPYLQYDWYRNPEEIAKKSLGGDNEAGLSDNGQFHKITGGVVFRPMPSVALKIDASAHFQTFNHKTEAYPEVRSSFSYLWGL